MAKRVIRERQSKKIFTGKPLKQGDSLKGLANLYLPYLTSMAMVKKDG